ncbi:MAG: hypothetical protein Q9219_000818 [cf. Caloplaca sp. 3 TL-2023]
MAWLTEDAAYARLNITDRNVDDGKVVASFHALSSTSPNGIFQALNEHNLTYVKALEIIATCRQSRLLLFILTVIPELSDHNVGLLTTATLPPVPENWTAKSNGGSNDPVIQNETVSDKLQTGPINSKEIGNGALGGAGRDSEEKPPSPPGSTLDAGSDSSVDFPSAADSDSSAEIPSSADSAPSESSADDSGYYHDGRNWRCELCAEPLTKCGCCDDDYRLVHRCIECDRDLDVERCAWYCSNCHAAEGEACLGCEVHDGDSIASDDPPNEIFEADVWRCATCLWEIEASDSEYGYCPECTCDDDASTASHEEDSSKGNRKRKKKGNKKFKLADYPDFEPADLDSSGPESEHSEWDSGDESFVDDDDPLLPNTEHLLAGHYDPYEGRTLTQTKVEEEGEGKLEEAGEPPEIPVDVSQPLTVKADGIPA